MNLKQIQLIQTIKYDNVVNIMSEIRKYVPFVGLTSGVGIMIYGVRNFSDNDRLGNDDPASLSNRILKEELNELSIFRDYRSMEADAGVNATLNIAFPKRPGGIISKLALRDTNDLVIPPGCDTVGFEKEIDTLSRQIVNTKRIDTTPSKYTFTILSTSN